MRLLIATNNQNKIREIRPILDRLPISLVTLRDLSAVPEVEESATTFWENARIKALAYAAASGLAAVAEDSGLEINALGGVPGVQSARFLGVSTPYPARFDEIYRRMGKSTDRRARFVSALAFVDRGEVLFETEAIIDGLVAPEPAGTHGFGYDPIFFYPPLSKTTGELTLEEKLAVSHRARAFRDFTRWLTRNSRP